MVQSASFPLFHLHGFMLLSFGYVSTIYLFWSPIIVFSLRKYSRCGIFVGIRIVSKWWMRGHRPLTSVLKAVIEKHRIWPGTHAVLSLYLF